jgi:hypothetical protein
MWGSENTHIVIDSERMNVRHVVTLEMATGVFFT